VANIWKVQNTQQFHWSDKEALSRLPDRNNDWGNNKIGRIHDVHPARGQYVSPTVHLCNESSNGNFQKLDEGRKKLNYKFFLNQKWRLTNQPMKTFKGTESFNVSNILFINDTAIICEMRNDIEIITQSILNHLTRFGQQMHMGIKQSKSKLEAIYYPTSITEAHMTTNVPLPIQLNNSQNNIQYMESLSTWAQL